MITMGNQKPKKKRPNFSLEPQLCKGCGYCVEECPKVVLELNKEPNRRGIHVVEVINAENCIMCRKCELICPEMAISIKADDQGGCEEN